MLSPPFQYAGDLRSSHDCLCSDLPSTDLQPASQSISRSGVGERRLGVGVPISLQWRNVSVAVPVQVRSCSFDPCGSAHAQILKNVSGSCPPGQLIGAYGLGWVAAFVVVRSGRLFVFVVFVESAAIMGSSGSGKSTLLNYLSGRLQAGNSGAAGSGVQISGELLLNGRVSAPSVVQSVSAYVLQDDILMSTLTPREIITFSSIFRLPNSMPLAVRPSIIVCGCRLADISLACNW